MLSGPATASAANTYVDGASGNDANDCTNQATPCQTIAAGLSQAGAGDTTFVADGTYAESLTLDQGKSLQSLDSTDPKPVITHGADGTTITVDGSGAGTVSGLRILSDYRSMDIQGRVTVDHDVFDQNPTSDRPVIQVESSASGVVISNNSLVDPDASGYSIGVILQSTAPPAPVISGNTFDGLGIGVLDESGADVTDNRFSGMHPLPSTPLPGVGVAVTGANPTISGNTFAAGSTHPSDGILVSQDFGPIPTGATISHNRISGNDVGVEVDDTTLPVTLSNDLIYGNTTGVASTDSSADAPPSPQGDVSATNETIFDNAVDASVSYTTLTLDSSILGTPVDIVGGNGACSISYSRGSSIPLANGCGNFATTADPQFVDAASADFHLQAGSPLIDAGGPANPGVGATDFYGGPRELQGKACSTLRRDIGAAEYDPGSTPACPPPPPSPGPPSQGGPPATRISTTPPRQAAGGTVTFRFFSDVPSARFFCKLDRQAFKPCSSPKKYRNLASGPHRFRVYAQSQSGQRGRAATFQFKVTQKH